MNATGPASEAPRQEKILKKRHLLFSNYYKKNSFFGITQKEKIELLGYFSPTLDF